MTEKVYYRRLTSALGEIGLVWTAAGGTSPVMIRRIFLPAGQGQGAMKARIREAFPGAIDCANDGVEQIIHQIKRYLTGDVVMFSLDSLDLKACGAFQQQVLRLEFQIPRGKVSTYGRLADRLGRPRAARAVGTALAQNPFPIIIPCHRTIRADGTLGGFGGGLMMKRNLLAMEGVRFDPDGRIMKDHII